MKSFAKKFYGSSAWKKCRGAYISQRVSIDGGLCEACHERIGYILHHKVKLTPSNINDPNITLNHALLKWECKQCHDNEEEHWNDSKNKNSNSNCFFDSKGQPIDLRKL